MACTHHGDEGTFLVLCSCGNVWKYGHYVGRVRTPLDPWARPEAILAEAAHEYSTRALKVTA